MMRLTAHVQLSATNYSITAQPSGNFADTNSLGNVTVLGVAGEVSNVSLNGQAINSGWTWDSNTNVLSLTGLNDLTSDGVWNSEWELTWSVNRVSGASGGNGTGSGSGSDSDSGAGSRYLSRTPLLGGLLVGLVGILGML